MLTCLLSSLAFEFQTSSEVGKSQKDGRSHEWTERRTKRERGNSQILRSAISCGLLPRCLGTLCPCEPALVPSSSASIPPKHRKWENIQNNHFFDHVIAHSYKGLKLSNRVSHKLLTVSVPSGVAGSSSPGGLSSSSSWACSARSAFWLCRHNVLSSSYSSWESTSLGSWLFRCSLNLKEGRMQNEEKRVKRGEGERRCSSKRRKITIVCWFNAENIHYPTTF